jgi:acetolactate synthase I/II/III large subunit
MKYSDTLASWLKEFGYTHFFYVGGGNVMHLVESFSRAFIGIPVIHEVAAGIAAEYFCATSDTGKAFALVTAGPGLTNITTAVGGAFLESRELLIIGGQAKLEDLSRGQVRQRGIQEIDGVSILKPICKKSLIIEEAWGKQKLYDIVSESWLDRPGPVFIEIPLDIQAKEYNAESESIADRSKRACLTDKQLAQIQELLTESFRPLLLIGGGVERSFANKLSKELQELGIPIATTWNGIDRVSSDHPLYVGRPNTWGQRSANIINQQSDLIIALGTRLGLQQTGFNWKSYCPNGKIVQIDIDEKELNKGHPLIDLGFAVDANDALAKILKLRLNDISEWKLFCQEVRKCVPIWEQGINQELPEYISPHRLILQLSSLCNADDIIVPCSSGGANTLMMQLFEQKLGQKVLNNGGLASMGYGLSGALGAAIANPHKRVVLVEGDGGFAQNIQEIGTVKINKCRLKMFIFDDGGYASIRMTQRSYFNGRYVGCDINTGLGLPDWCKLFEAWKLSCFKLDPNTIKSAEFLEAFNNSDSVAFIVRINPDQTYYPKITSRILDDGSMESNPLHHMTPDLLPEIKKIVFRYI